MSDYSEDTLRKAKNFGFLQYSVEKCIIILNPEQPEQFKFDIQDEGHPLCIMYQNGLNTGRYNLDAAEFKIKDAESQIKLMELSREKLYHAKLLEISGSDDN